MNDRESTPKTDRSQLVDEFIGYYTRHQRPLFTYILSLVANVTEAEELLQQTNFILWKKFEEFRPGSNFGAWASKVAYFEVMKYYESRDQKAQPMDPQFLESVSEKMIQNTDLFDRRTAALNACLETLSQSNRRLLRLRYAPGADVKTVALALHRPLSTVYKAVTRVRQLLLECIERRLSREEQA